MVRRLFFILVLAGQLCATSLAQEEGLVLIANPESGIKAMDRDTAINLFMGRFKKLPSGITALPLDLTGDRETFYRQLVNKRLPEINSYWARLVFSGRASPPRQIETPEEVLEIVANNRGAIGYVPRGATDDRVVVLADLFALTERDTAP
jgi:hypothetical protein